MNASLNAWLKQPSTVHAIAVGAATVAGLAVYYATHATEPTIAATGFVFTAVAGALPDSAGTKSSVEKLVLDAVQAAAAHKVHEMMPSMLADVQRVLTSGAAPVTMTTETATVLRTGPAAPAPQSKPLFPAQSS